MHFVTFLVLCTISAAIGSLAGCGVKTDPVPYVTLTEPPASANGPTQQAPRKDKP